MRSKPKNIYDMADFRGLLHADYKDTIKGAFSKVRNEQESPSEDKKGAFATTRY
jgi:hypothetical protein